MNLRLPKAVAASANLVLVGKSRPMLFNALEESREGKRSTDSEYFSRDAMRDCLALHPSSAQRLCRFSLVRAVLCERQFRGLLGDSEKPLEWSIGR